MCGGVSVCLCVLFYLVGSLISVMHFCMQHMASEDEAQAAIAALDGYTMNGSQIHVEVSYLLNCLPRSFGLHASCWN